MASAHRCNFAESSVEFTDALARIEPVLRECKLELQGSIARIESTLGSDVSFYTEEGHDLTRGLEVETLQDAVQAAASWDGIALCGLWRDVLDVAGNALLIEAELDLYVGRTPEGCRLAFEEGRALNDLRIEEPELEANFYRFLVSLCDALEVCGCAYGGETSVEPLVVNERALEEMLASGKLPDGAPLGTIVFRTTPNAWPAQQAQARSYHRELALSPKGYGLLKLEPVD